MAGSRKVHRFSRLNRISEACEDRLAQKDIGHHGVRLIVGGGGGGVWVGVGWGGCSFVGAWSPNHVLAGFF